MSEKRERNLWKELDRFAFLASGFVILLLGVTYFAVGLSTPAVGSFWAVARSFALDVIANLIPVFLLFVVSYALFRTIQELRSERETEELASKIAAEIRTAIRREPPAGSPADSTYYDEFGYVPWNELLSTCSTLDICVHYFDTWINSNSQLIQQLFDRGGVIRIILPNYKRDDIVATIKQRFPEYTVEQIRAKISNTHSRLALLLEKSTHKNARVETYFIDDMMWYCALRFDRRILVLSVYEHMREMRIGAPAVMISLGKFEATQRWIEKEISGLALVKKQRWPQVRGRG